MSQAGTLPYQDRRVLSLRVRVLHWLIVLLAGVTALAVSAPSVLRQQTFYQSSAVVRFDPQQFPDLIDAQGQPTQTLIDGRENLGAVLATQFEDLRRQGLAYNYDPTGQITITANRLDPLVAERLAGAAAEGLTRRIYASIGLPMLREILGYEQEAAYEGRPKQDREDELLRYMLLAGVVENVMPQQGDRTIASLTPFEREAITRALEVHDEMIQLDWRTADVTIAISTDEAAIAEAREKLRGAATATAATRLLLNYMGDTYNTQQIDLTQAAPAFIAEPASQAVALPTYTRTKLAIAAAVGLLGGLLTVVIDRQVGILGKLQELWTYRELIRNMIGRDLKARYKGSVLGYVWSLLNPLLMMLVFWVVFSLLLNNNIPMFPVFLIVALLPWTYTVSAVSGGMRSILDNANLVKKVYFPREILPITVVLSNLVNYLFALPVMFLVMAGVQWFQLDRLNFSWTFAILPVIIVIQTIFLIGMALLLSTTAVFFRDTTHLIDIFIQLWIFLTPVFFALEQVATAMQARVLRWINPMASIIDFYRDVLYGQIDPGTIPAPGLPALDGVFRTLLTALLVLAIGSYAFHRSSGRFGEEI